MINKFLNHNTVELLSINLLNIGFISAELLIQGIPVIMSILVGTSIIAVNVLKFYKELKNK
jgi:hypothetical protein